MRMLASLEMVLTNENIKPLQIEKTQGGSDQGSLLSSVFTAFDKLINSGPF
jgi:hypothetical protein